MRALSRCEIWSSFSLQIRSKIWSKITKKEKFFIFICNLQLFPLFPFSRFCHWLCCVSPSLPSLVTTRPHPFYLLTSLNLTHILSWPSGHAIKPYYNILLNRLNKHPISTIVNIYLIFIVTIMTLTNVSIWLAKTTWLQHAFNKSSNNKKN